MKSQNIYAITKEVRAFASAKGLQVVFEKECPCPRTNGKVMFVPIPQTTWNEEEMLKWRHSVLHEAGHNDPRARDCFDLARDLNLDMQSFMGVAINCIDDNRNEKIDVDVMQGKRYVMDKGNYISRKELIEKGFYRPHEDHRMKIIQTISLWDHRERVGWLPSMGEIYGDAVARIDGEMETWLARLQPYEARLASLVTARQEWELLKDVLKNVFDYTEEDLEKEIQQCTAPGKGEGHGKGEASEEAGDGSDGEGDGSAEGSGEGDGEARKRGARATAKYSDILIHKHDNEEDGGSYAPLKIEYSEGDYGRGSFKVDLDPTVCSYPKGEGPNMDGGARYIEMVEDGFNSYSFANKLKKLLQVRMQDLVVHGQKQGRFDRKNIYRATMPDAGGYSERVFRTTLINNVLDRAVGVLVDCSGSMGGEKYRDAIRSAVLLNESLGKVGVPFEIVGFTDTNKAYFPVFKEFGKRILSSELIKYMAAWGEYKMSNNADGEALEFMEERLLRRKEKGKLLIVLSDGSPATRRGDAYTHTINVAKRIEKEKLIDLIAIGIEDNNVERIYKKSKVIAHSDQLENTIIELLKSNIIK